jgi:hypothetical protein
MSSTLVAATRAGNVTRCATGRGVYESAALSVRAGPPRRKEDRKDHSCRSRTTKRRQSAQSVDQDSNQKAEHRESIEPRHEATEQCQNPSHQHNQKSSCDRSRREIPPRVWRQVTEAVGPVGAAARRLRAEPAGRATARLSLAHVSEPERDLREAPRPNWPARSIANRDSSTGRRRSTRTTPAARSQVWQRGPQRRRSRCHDPNTRSARSGRPRLAVRRGSRPLGDPSVSRRVRKRSPIAGQAAASTPRRSWMPSISGGCSWRHVDLVGRPRKTSCTMQEGRH